MLVLLLVIWGKGISISISWLILWTKGEPTIITWEMFSVFGSLKASSMKYLSPIGVCLTVTSNTEQSGAKICEYLFNHLFKISLVPGGHGLSHGISWILTSVGSSGFAWLRVTTAWFGSFLQSAVHLDQSVHLLNAPVMVRFQSISRWQTFESPLHCSRTQVVFPGFNVPEVGKLAQDLSGCFGEQVLWTRSFPSPQVSVQRFVSSQSPNTKGANIHKSG